MAKTTLIIKDEVNARFRGLDEGTLARCKDAMTFYVPGFNFMPTYIAGRWDGTIPLFHKTGATHINLLPEVLPIIESQGYHDISIEDHRQDYSEITDDIDPVEEDYFGNIMFKGAPFLLRDYQLAGINAALQGGTGLLEMATGSGKTLVCATLSDIYSQYGRVVVIVPSIDLIVQTQDTFRQVGLDTGVWFGTVKHRKQITIATWQSLDHFPELFEGVVCIIVDEAHQAKAKVLSEMLSGPGRNVPFRFGCTGTLPKEDLFQFQIKANIGEKVFQLRTWELQEKGVLADASIFQLEFQDTSNDRYVKYSRTFEDWAGQINYLMSDSQRLRHLGALIEDMSQETGNTLVLVQYRKHGKALQEHVRGAISLDGRDKDRTKYYERFNETDGNTLICTFGIASTGLDIPRIFNLVLIEPGKKFEKVIQSLGRGVRRADDKDYLMVFDIASDDGYSANHAKQRKGLYLEARQTFEKIKVVYE